MVYYVYLCGVNAHFSISGVLCQIFTNPTMKLIEIKGQRVKTIPF
jgi:hypothetical protein